jgi:short-subunit dehydrogenase
MESTSHKGEFAVVTGASSGIGYELARVFAKNGFDLLICSEDKGIYDSCNALRAMNVSVDVCLADLSTFEGVEFFAAAIRECNRPVDAICINAGVGVSGEFEKTDLTRELQMIALNVDSTVHLTKRILPDMIARGSGRILYTSSIAGTMPGPYLAVYAATKAFVQSFAEAIRFEVKDKGITVTSLQPGATDTNFFARADMLDTPAGRAKKDDPAAVAKDGFDALMAGRDHVVAGSMMNNAMAGTAKVVPEKIGAAMQARQTIPDGVKNQK